MYDGHVPPHAEEALRGFENALADLRTRRIRLERVEVPDVEGPSPREMAEAAARPDAPAELRAVARAVAEGRAGWDDVLAGRVDAAPEVAALFDASRERFAALMERGRAEDERLERLARTERAEPAEGWDR